MAKINIDKVNRTKDQNKFQEDVIRAIERIKKELQKLEDNKQDK